jgi:LCP family protein required for cell wall assembly
LCSAGGSAVFVLEQVHSLRDALSQNGVLRVAPGSLASAGWGDPQTLLLVGDDQRSLTRYYHVAVPHLANEMLLVRLDPSQPYISMMSIPRELAVPITRPNGTRYVGRLNSAYTYGIPTLLTTIKQVTGLSVNHVIVITFGRFKRAVNEMGCVYSTVDQRYYHVNVPGGPQYQEINLQPGYQKLCGDHALQFVSYRHGDTSLVRDARDQSFLMDVKKEYGPTLADNIGKFEHIFGKAVQTDPGLQSTTGLLNLLGTLISSSGRRVRQVHFQANLMADTDSASPQQIASSVHAFLYGGSSIPKSRTAAVASAVHKHNAITRLPLVPTPSSTLGQARADALHLPFPVEFPRVEDAGGSVIPPFLRTYLIHAPDGSAYPAYVAAFYGGTLGEYYDVQGMTWTTAPQFDSPDQKVQVGGRTYYLFYEASNLRMVAWYQNNAVYWVRNTLTDSVSNGEMLAIAEQTSPFTAVHAGPGTVPVVLKAAGVPLRTTVTKPTSLRLTLGTIAGLLTLIALPVFLFLAVRQIREIRRARADLASGRQAGDALAARGALAYAGSASGGGAAGLGSVGVGRPVLTATRWSEETRIYRGRRFRGLPLILALVIILAILAGATAFVLLRHDHASAAKVPPHKAARVVTRPEVRVPVVVLDASSTLGPARRLAASLTADHVTITSVGNVTESRPPGTEVLYAPGARSQAEALARLLREPMSAVAPIDPVTDAAAGGRAQLVVVIT